MSSTSNYSSLNTSCLPGRNVQISNLHVCEDVNIDGELIVVGTATINGVTIPAPVNNRILRTDGAGVVSWGSVNPNNLTGGAVNEVLQTVAPGVVAWSSLVAAEIPPGLADQILITDPTGTSSQWSSDIVPTNVDVSNQLEVFGLTKVADIDISGDLTINTNPGLINQVLTKTGLATQDWVTLSVSPSEMTPGVSNQVLVTDPTGTFVQWASDVIIPNDLTVTNDLNVFANCGINGNLNVTGFVAGGACTFNGSALFNDTVQLTDGLIANLSQGLAGQVLLSQGSAVTPTWGSVSSANITQGAANQVLVTDNFASAAVWSDNLLLNGTLTVNGISDFNADVTTSDLDVGGDLAFNTLSGTINDVIVKTGATTQQWSNSVILNTIISTFLEDIQGDLAFNSNSGLTGQFIRKTSANTQDWFTMLNASYIRFCTAFAAQDLNAGAGPTAVVFDNVNVISSNAKGTITTPLTITQPSTTQFTIRVTGEYDVDITGYFDAASAGIGNSIISLSAEVNGVEIGDGCVTNNTGYSFCGKIPSLQFTAGQNLRILTRRIAGANALNTNAPLSAAPNFTSTIAITLVSTVA